MRYPTVKLHTKSDLLSILKSNPNGVIRNYLLNIYPSSKPEKIVYLSNALVDLFTTNVFIEVKYPYSLRVKRIEICFLRNNNLYLCKISNSKEFDKDAIEMDYLISDIVKNLDIAADKIFGLIFIEGDFKITILSPFKKKLKNNFLFFPFLPASQVDILKNGLFNK